MIIDDEDPGSPTKLDQPQALPAARREAPEDAPPAYTGPSTPYPAPVHDAQAGPSSSLLDPEAQLPKEEPAGKRFFKAFAIAVAIWLTIAILSGGTIRSTYPTIREGVVSPPCMLYSRNTDRVLSLPFSCPLHNISDDLR